MKSMAEYVATMFLFSFIVIFISDEVCPSFQLLKVRISLPEAERVTSVPFSYIFLLSTTVGAGAMESI